MVAIFVPGGVLLELNGWLCTVVTIGRLMRGSHQKDPRGVNASPSHTSQKKDMNPVMRVRGLGDFLAIDTMRAKMAEP
jgi:hypothetical protein